VPIVKPFDGRAPPGPIGGAYNAPPDSLLNLRGMLRGKGGDCQIGVKAEKKMGRGKGGKKGEHGKTTKGKE